MYKIIFWMALLVGIGSWVVFAYQHMPYKTPAGTVYEMPAECEGDLSKATKDTKVFNQPSAHLAIWNRFLKIAPEGWRLFGATVNLPGFPPFIVMDESLGGELYAQTLHHERCHIVAGAWHG